MIIELIGPSGAGKTYMASKISRERNLPDVRFRGHFEKLAFAGMYVVLHPVRSVFLITASLRGAHRWSFLKYKLWILLAGSMAREQKAQWHHNGVIDEGFLQYLYASFFETAATREQIDAFLARVRLSPREVLFVDAPQEIRERRMETRGRIPRSLFDDAHRAAWKDRLAVNGPLVAGALADVPSFSFKRIMNP